MSDTAAPSPFRAELGATLRLAGPLALANMLQMAVYAIDVIFVARLGQEALAASSLAVTLFSILMWGFTGITGAAAPLIAAELGRKAHAVREVRRTMRMGLWLAVICGMVGMSVCAFAEDILLAAGQTARIAMRAGHFMDILLWMCVPMIVANVLRIFVSTMGRPVFATFITALAIGVNALGNYALVFGNLGAPALGLEGSAIASVTTSVVTVLAYLLVIRTDRKMRRYHILGHWWRTEWKRLRLMIKLGTPIALTIVAEGGLFGGAAFLMGLIGEAQLAGHTIALQVAAFAFQVPLGIAQASTIRVGFHFGAADATGVGLAGRASLISAMLFMAVPASVMILFPRLVLSAYIDVHAPVNAVMVSFAVQYLAIAAAFQLFDGIQCVAAGALRGLQDTRVPMVIAISGYWLGGFVTAVVLGFFTPLSGVGIWIGLAVGLVIVSVLLLARWRKRTDYRLVPAIPTPT